MEDPSISLMVMVRQLQQEHGALRSSFFILDNDHAALGTRCEAAETQLAHWKSEALRLAELNRVKEGVVARYAQLLAMHDSDIVGTASSIQDSSWQIPVIEQKLAQRDAEVEAMRQTVDDTNRISAHAARLQGELDDQRLSTMRAEAQVAPLQARLDECTARQKELRIQLGKSELERQRQSTQFQSELSGTTKRLRAAKSQNEQLLRRVQQDQQPLYQPAKQQPPPQALVNSGSSRGMAHAFRPPAASSSIFGAGTGLRQF